MKRLFAGIAATGLMSISVAAFAATASRTFQVSATVVSRCVVTTSGSAVADGSSFGSGSVTCTRNAPVFIQMEPRSAAGDPRLEEGAASTVGVITLIY